MKPILVGLHNPHSPYAEFALWPYPHGGSGDRLCRLLGLTPMEYLALFDRVNLLIGGGGALVWSRTMARMARHRACELLEYYAREEKSPRHWILLGARVCAAFALPFEPMLERRLNGDFVSVLPHPSGRCRVWNAPASVAYVKRIATQSHPSVPISVEVK